MSLRSKTATRVGRVRQYPSDLALLTVATLACYLALSVLDVSGELRLLVALPLLLFFPGYALVAVLFPARARRARAAAGDRPQGIDTIERVALSFALSFAVTPVVVMALALTERGLGTDPITIVLTGVTIAIAQLGVVRRLRVPVPDRYVASPRASVDAVFASREGLVGKASAILLAAAILLAVGALLFAFVSPLSGAEFTQLGLYTENGGGELVAGDLPEEVGAGESVSLAASIENYEGEPVEYTLVVQEQYYEDGEVVERTELETVDATVADGETETVDLEVSPTASSGERVRVSLLLYEGEPPTDPTNENADGDVFFWVTVDGTAGEGAE